MKEGDKSAIDNVKELEEGTIEAVCNVLRGYSAYVKTFTLGIVASLCNVSCDAILGGTREPHVVCARWLFWYVLNRLFQESSNSISLQYSTKHKFTLATISQGIAKMNMMISEQPIWAKRWSIVKRIVNEVNKVEEDDLRSNDTVHNKR